MRAIPLFKPFCSLVALAMATQLAGQETRILFIAGEASHGWNKHEFPAGCELLAKCLRDSDLPLEAIVSQGWPSDRALIDSANAIVIYSDGNDKHIALGKEAVLDARYEEGTGFAVLHYALEPGEPLLEAFLDRAIGGHFKVDWSVNPVWTLSSPTLSPHPITRGVTPFTLEDEWYYHMKFSLPSSGRSSVLETLPPLDSLGEDGPRTGNPAVREALADGVPQSLAWVKVGEKGQRGFGYTGGHFHYNWNNEQIRKLVLNGIAWTAGLPVPNGGIESTIVPIAQHQSIEHAIALGDLDDVERHLAGDPDILNQPGRGSYTPLHQAILRKKPAIISALLSRGADPNITTKSGQTALHIAISRNDLASCKTVIRAGATLAAKDGNGWTPLHLAAAKNRIELVTLLLDSGAEINALSNAGGTALHEASVSGSKELIELLLDRGVDAGIVSSTGKTAYDHAVEFNNEAALSLLNGAR